jgi:two-component system OmpR family response regulator
VVFANPTEFMREPLSILIVDDEPLVARAVARFLEHCGCHIAVCNDGHTAMKRLSAHPFGLLITDLGLPKDGGRYLLDFVHRTKYQCQVIVMTGKGVQEEWLDLYSTPMLFLQKPFDMDVLLGYIEAIPKQNTRGIPPATCNPKVNYGRWNC